MKKNKNIFTLLVMALIGLSLTACSNDELDTNQYKGGISLNVYGPNPVMRGGTLRFLGSNLDQIASIQIPGVAAITSFETVKAGVPSEIRVAIPKEGPEVGFVTLTTKGDQTITTKTKLNYIEGIEITEMPASAMAGDEITIKGEYLNLIYSLAFADGVVVGESDFVSHDRYAIKVTVPEDAKTGKLELYTADLTVLDRSSVDYQTIVSEEAIEIGVPSITQIKGRNTAEALGTIEAKAGEKITISGSYFNVVDDVTVSGVSVADLAMAEDGSSMVFTLPAEAPSGDIMIICKSGVEVPVGTLTTVKPTEGVAAPNPAKAGQPLTITGKDMDLVTSVMFPDKDGEYTVDGGSISAEAAKVVVSELPAKAVEGNLRLITACGEYAEVAFKLVKPTVTGYDNTTVSAGGALTIQGTDLDLVVSVQFGESSFPELKATANAITLTVPMDATSGAPTLTLANGTTVENVPEININEALFCYITQLPGEEDELKAGNAMTVPVSNGDKLTGVQMNGTDCQWILTGENKDQLIIGIPESASATSQLRLVSSNGETTYDIAVIPATSVSKTVWTGLTQLTWGDGGRVLIPAAAFEGVPEGAIITFAYSQVENQWDQAQVNYGDWSGINFTEGGEGVVTFSQTLVPTDIYGWFSDGILNRETSMVLTSEILNNIQAKKGDCGDQTNLGIIIQGSGLTFSKVTISYEISLEQKLENCIVNQGDQSALMPFPIKMAWDDTGRFRILIDKDPAIKDMKLVAGKSTMYFYTTGTGQLQINNANWSAMTTLAEWNDAGDKKMELVLTQDMVDWLKGVQTDGWSSTGMIIQGDGMTVSKITILP